MFFQRMFVATPLVFGGRVFRNPILQTRTGGGKSKDNKKWTKKGKTTQKGFFNPLNISLTKKILILFVGNWLVKPLVKPLVSVGRKWGFFGPAVA